MSTQSKTLILIDTSYTSFYRFFATLKWMSMSQPDEYKEHKANKKYDWSQNKIFIEKYEKMYLESIVKLVKKKTMKNSKIIFCMDSTRSTLWRTEIDSKYKGERADLSLKTDFKPTFNYTYNEIIPKILKENDNISAMKVDKCEADDIIAVITMEEKKKNPNREIIIVSGDNDFLQLGRPNVKFINYKTKKYVEYTEEEAKLLLHEKILLGDKSDNIESILSNNKVLSASKRKELLTDINKFNDYAKDNKKLQDAYTYNKKMIDFNFIPKKYYDKMSEEYYLIK
jgi:5'-3' exonuclease